MGRAMSAGLRLLAAWGLLLAGGPARAAWMEASSDHFLVYGDVAPDRIAKFADRLERFDSAMRGGILNLPDERPAPANRLTVYIVNNEGAVQRLCGRGAQCQNVAGFYEGRASGSVAFSPAHAGDGSEFSLNADIVLFHEYSHHLLMGSRLAQMPGWLNEGLAEFASTAKISDQGAVEIGSPALHRAYDLIYADQMPVAKLLTADRRKLAPDERFQLYSRGWLLADYLTFAKDRHGQLDHYLELVRGGQPGLDAGKASFGDLGKLDHELDAYKRQRTWPVFRISAEKLHVGKVTLRPLRPGEAAMMPYRMRSDRGVTPETAVPLADAARAAAAAHADDPWVEAVMAEIEYDAGNYDAAEAAADKAIAGDPGTIDALVYKGLVHLRRAAADKAATPDSWREARSWLVKANHLQPDDAYPLVCYYDSFRAARQPAPELAARGLERAGDLVPQDRGIQIRLAALYLQEGKLPLARTALAVLAFDPHAQPDNPAAKLVAMIDAGADLKTIVQAAKIETEPGAQSQ